MDLSTSLKIVVSSVAPLGVAVAWTAVGEYGVMSVGVTMSVWEEIINQLLLLLSL